ncbi:MAG: recombination mediator RecR [Steroidobacteraceae bacterium]
MKHSPLLAELIESLRALPGVGPKTAQRMAFHLLLKGRPAAQRLSTAMAAAIDKVGRCRRCRMLTEGELCAICAANNRDASLLCVVESPADVVAIEQAAGYRGRYFVLLGHLSPLDGVGPIELGAEQLGRILREGEVAEMIIATNRTVEGEATAHFLSELARTHSVGASRIAHGVPLGGELEYVDFGTLAQAITARQALQ